MPRPLLLDALLASTPILVVLLLMLAARWPAARAGAAGFAVAAAVAVGFFGFGADGPSGLGYLRTFTGVLAEALHTAATVVWIILPALGIYWLQQRTGAMAVLQRSIRRISSDGRILGLMVAWFLALFLEGAAGFGTPVALTTPLLVSLGYAPVDAVALALVGHSIGVSFGAVGAPVLAQIEATGMDPLQLSRAAGIYQIAIGWMMALAVMVLIRRATRQRSACREGECARGVWGWTLLAGAFFLVPYYVVARWVGPELPTMLGGLVGGVAFIAALRWAARRHAAAVVQPEAPLDVPADGLWRAGSTYLVLVALVLATRLVAPLRVALADVRWGWSLFGAFEGTVQPLYHPGTLLFLAMVAGAVLQRATHRDVRAVVAGVGHRVLGIGVALVAMLALARVMVHSGMTDALAQAAAHSLGSSWPVLAPFVGVLGTFITGSGTASNILFTNLQVATAGSLGLPVAPLVGVQDLGAAVGNAICPHNVIAGGATVGIVGREGEVLRRTMWPTLLYALLGGLLALLFAHS